MLRRSAAAWAVCLAFAPALRAEEAKPAPTTQETLIAARAGNIVSVKMSLAISFTAGGSVQESERNQTTTGVVMNERGLVMVSAQMFGGGMPRRFRSMVSDLKVTPTSLRVVFPGDPKEYAAILGAKDSDLGLAFLLIKDLAGRQVAPLDLTRCRDPRIGETLYGVTRLGEDFDHAPMASTVDVVARVNKPRSLWVLDGADDFSAEPLYTSDGCVAGVVMQQEGAGEDAGMQTCLLPLSVAQSLIQRSMRVAEEALAELLETEAEGGDEPAEDVVAPGAEGAADGGEAEEGDDDADDDADEDAAK